MTKSKRKTRAVDPAEVTTRAQRLKAIGAGEPDPCTPDEEVMTRQTRLDAIGAGDPDPAFDESAPAE